MISRILNMIRLLKDVIISLESPDSTLMQPEQVDSCRIRLGLLVIKLDVGLGLA